MIALCGYAGVGKDAVGNILVQQFGYTRKCFGDIIKQQLDDLCRTRLGFTAFTEVRDQKERLRPLLEAWGDVNYGQIMDIYFSHLPELVVNTRLCRPREAQEWRLRGGQIWWITRPGYGPVTAWESDCYDNLRTSGGFDHFIENDGSLSHLQHSVEEILT